MNLKHVLINSKWKDKSGHIYLWQDIWFGETPLVEFASSNPPITLCAEVMLLQNGIWNTNLFSPFLPQNIRQAIIQENLSLSNVKDHLIWKPDPKGIFSIKFAWSSLCSQYSPLNLAKFIWQPRILLKVSTFGWRLFRNIISFVC